jgi:hypothetical protein
VTDITSARVIASTLVLYLLYFASTWCHSRRSARRAADFDQFIEGDINYP